MDFTILNWNIGGAKYLESPKKKRADAKKELNAGLQKLIDSDLPQVITLQEVAWHKEPDKNEEFILDNIDGYKIHPFKLIDSKSLSATAKWKKVEKLGGWDKGTYFAQGNAMLFKNDLPHYPVWDLSYPSTSPPSSGLNYIEQVNLQYGLYFGDRDTEPRAALVAHFIFKSKQEGRDLIHEDLEELPGTVKFGELSNKISYDESKRLLFFEGHMYKKEKDALLHLSEDECYRKAIEGLYWRCQKPVDIFVVNLHLTTLMTEREGVPEIDLRASKTRQDQLNVIFYGIVSRYNAWKRQCYPMRGERRGEEKDETFNRHEPIWILAGDFNFTPESVEYSTVMRTNFIDTVPYKGEGTKARGFGQPPSITLDYIFAGPKFIAFNPIILALEQNKVNTAIKGSDHYAMFSKIPIMLP